MSLSIQYAVDAVRTSGVGHAPDASYADGKLFVIARGQGGPDGDEAARGAVEHAATLAALEVVAPSDVAAMVAGADVAIARSQVGDDGGRSRAGATMAGLCLTHIGAAPHWLIFSVGGCSVYMVGNRHVFPVTLGGQRGLGRGPTRAERLLGVGRRPMPDVWVLPAREGDRFVLCSDGLTATVSDRQMSGILTLDVSPDEAVAALLELAASVRNPQDATAIVVDVCLADDITAEGESPGARSLRLVGHEEDAAPRWSSTA